jgi:type IV secretory pathway TrbL component
MTASKILSAVAVALMAVAGSAHAESYEGVHPLTSGVSRAEVASEAVAAAHSADPYATGAQSGPARAFVSTASVDAVRAEAVAAARSADPYAEGASSGVAPLIASTVDRATVRAAARAAAHGDALPL